MKKEQCASHAAVYFASFPERSSMIARLVKAPAENMVNEEKKASKKQIGNKFKLHSGMLCFYMEMKKNLEAVFIPFR